MATTKFTLSKRHKSGQKAELNVRFSYKRGSTFRLRTGIYVPVDAWSDSSGKLVIPRIHSNVQIKLKELQMSIDSLSNHLKTAAINASTSADSKYWERVINEFHGLPQDNPEVETATQTPTASVDDLFGQFIDQRVKNAMSKRQMGTSRHVLQRFSRYKKTEYALEDWNGELLKELEDFLRIEHTFFDKKGNCKRKWKHIYSTHSELRAKRVRGENAIFSIMKKIRTFFYWCVETGKLEVCPFKDHKLTECVYGTPYYLTKEELSKLYHFDFSGLPKLAIQRDIFILQSSLGMRVGDFYALTKSNVVSDAIEYIPSKTINEKGEVVRVPLTARAKEIIKRYSKSDRLGLLPLISEQQYNKAIKKMLKLAGINRIVTVLNPTTRIEEQRPINEVASSHMARRNFIGNLYAKVQDPTIISSMTGHKKGSIAFERYRAIDDGIKKKVLNVLDD